MNSHHSRRIFLKRTTQAAIALPIVASASGFTSKPLATDKPVLVEPEPTSFSSLLFNVKDYGAVGDGMVRDTEAIQQTIDRCHVLGGGTVYFPAGVFLSGAIQLRSHVCIKLDTNAEIKGTADFADYPVSQLRWEGKWVKGHVALLYAIDCENIAIVGNGKISGNHSLGGRPNAEMPNRHPALIEPINCKRILLDGFSTDYYLMWSVHPTYCSDIQIRNLTIRSTGGNGDGIDLDSCRNVIIDNCDIATGDDCISLKSGRGMEGNLISRPTENVRITHCKFSDSIFACIGIGSETSGGIRNVSIENCTFYDTKTHAIYIKTRPGRGAFIENISVNNIEVSGMQGGCIRFNLLGSGIQDPDPVPGMDGIPRAKNFSFKNIRVHNVPVLIDGTSVHPDKPLDGLLIENVTGTCQKGISLANCVNVKLKEIDVTNYAGSLLNIINVTGEGLDGAQLLNAPKLPEPIAEPAVKYNLR